MIFFDGGFQFSPADIVPCSISPNSGIIWDRRLGLRSLSQSCRVGLSKGSLGVNRVNRLGLHSVSRSISDGLFVTSSSYGTIDPRGTVDAVDICCDSTLVITIWGERSDCIAGKQTKMEVDYQRVRGTEGVSTYKF